MPVSLPSSGSVEGPTPVTVLTGFLGSGKTTLLNRLLADPRFRDTAVLVNEWGEIAIDHALVRASSENVVTLPSGCICCRVAGELLGTLRELHFQRAAGAVPPFRRVVIETTGLADPAPLLATLIEMPAVAARYSLAGVVTTVDAEHGMATLDAHPEAVKQAALADRLVVTKVVRAAPERVRELQMRLATLIPGPGCSRAVPVPRTRRSSSRPASTAARAASRMPPAGSTRGRTGSPGPPDAPATIRASPPSPGRRRNPWRGMISKRHWRRWWTSSARGSCA